MQTKTKMNKEKKKTNLISNKFTNTKGENTPTNENQVLQVVG